MGSVTKLTINASVNNNTKKTLQKTTPITKKSNSIGNCDVVNDFLGERIEITNYNSKPDFVEVLLDWFSSITFIITMAVAGVLLLFISLLFEE